jgi:hypothetical protein
MRRAEEIVELLSTRYVREDWQAETGWGFSFDGSRFRPSGYLSPYNHFK